jgi:hypothetical protein
MTTLIRRWLSRADSVKYSGESPNGDFCGETRFVWPDGAIYQGDIKNGKRHGQGVFVWPDGSRYSGSFYEGQRCGRGLWSSPDLELYHGEWQDDLRHGWGIWVERSGRLPGAILGVRTVPYSYCGEWRNGLFHGFGVCTSRQGDFVIAERRDGERYRDISEVAFADYCRDSNFPPDEDLPF